MESGKRIEMIYNGKAVTILNQRSRLWTHPYDYRTPQKATLSSAGCGVFSICHCGQWLTGKAFSPEELADFSMQNGGRGDDGTDRPALLSAMMQKGLAAQYGFSYQGDGLRNDLETLRVHLLEHRGVALCAWGISYRCWMRARRTARCRHWRWIPTANRWKKRFVRMCGKLCRKARWIRWCETTRG